MSLNYPLSISQVDLREDRVQSRCRPPLMVLIQEDGRLAHLQPQLLDPLGVIDREQEGPSALLRPNGSHEGEVLWKFGLWKVEKRREVSRLLNHTRRATAGGGRHFL